MIFGIQPWQSLWTRAGRMSSWNTLFLISIEPCGLSEFTSCTKPLHGTATSLCTTSLVWWAPYSFPKEMSLSRTDHALGYDFARPLHTEARMQDWISTLIMWNVSFCCMNNSPQCACWCNCNTWNFYLGVVVSIIWLYIYIFMFCVYLLALFSAYMIT